MRLIKIASLRSRLILILTTVLFCHSLQGQVHEYSSISIDKISIYKIDGTSDDINVYTGCLDEDEIKNAQPVFGTYNNVGDSITFVPFVPLSYNQEYSLQTEKGTYCFDIPLPVNYQNLEVIATFPSSKTIPANILKWYVCFSKPVNPANTYDHVFLLDMQGDTLPRTILNLENPLLSEDGKMLTIWVEPGRQKRGLGPNLELGPIFKIGQKYQLVISKGLKDNEGVKMLSDWKFEFIVGQTDRTKININSWKTQTPGSDSRDPLVIGLNESIDFGSFSDSYYLTDLEGNEVSGQWKLDNFETIVYFTPDKNWLSGEYYLLISPALEDLAGNNLTRLFDQPLTENNEGAEEDFQLSFVIH